MRFSNKLKISTSLYALFGISAALLSGQALYAVIGAVGQRHQATQVEQMAKANRQLFIGLQATRVERGPTRTALEAKPAANPAFIASLPPLRAEGKPAIENLISACEHIDCGSPDASGAIRDALQKVEEIRSKVDDALHVPLEQRPPGIAKQWNAVATVLVNELQHISGVLSSRIRMVDPIDGELMGIEEASYTMRDGAGLERNYIQKAMEGGSVTPALRAPMEHLRGQVDAAWHILQGLVDRPGVPAPVMAAVHAAKTDYFGTFVAQRTSIEKALDAHTKPPLTEEQLVNASNRALDVLVRIPSQALDAVIAHSQERSSTARSNLILQIGLLALSLVLAAAGFLLAWRRIARPIDTMAEAMRQVAGGDLAIEVPYADRADEIGHLAQALQVFKQNGLEKQRIEGEQEAERQARQLRADNLENLTRSFEAKVGELVRSLASAATEMEATAGSMSATAAQTGEQTLTVTSAAEQASANVQTVAAAAEELSASIGEISRQIAQSNAIVSRAVADAQSTDEVVHSLATGAQKIGDVVKLIQDIAGQTNLLALNATIEAARAGEAGKGFAVVASEVKALAGQTGKATEEIAGQVTQIQEATQRTVEAIRGISATIGEVSKIATSIAAAVEQQGSATAEIARNVQQAAEGTHQVSQNIVGVREATTATGAAATEVLSAAGAVSRQSDDLSGEVQAFLAGVRAA